MDRKNEYIAVFDSGVGGISVLRELRRELPNERFLYFGDSANAPYGDKTVEEVRRLTLAAAEMLPGTVLAAKTEPADRVWKRKAILENGEVRTRD